MASRTEESPASILYIDAGVFMGMHSADEQVRIASKNLFVRCWQSGLHMTLDQVGICDAVVWLRSREVQDDYYPFMDQLHTLMRIDRVPYTVADLTAASTDGGLDDLSAHARLTLAKVRAGGARLLTWDPGLIQRPDTPAEAPEASGAEARFPGELEDLYARSLALRLSLDEVYDYGTEARRHMGAAGHATA